MQSLMLVGSKKGSDIYIDHLLQKFHIKSYYVERFEGILTISGARNIKKKLTIKIPENETQLLIITADITFDAQHALLKILEEGPTNAIIALCAPTRDALLATIVSRCQVVDCGVDVPSVDASFVSLFDTMNASISLTTLYQIAGLIQKENLKSFLLSLRAFIRQKIENQETLDPQIVKFFYEFFENFYVIQHNNINTRLYFEQALFRLKNEF